MDPALTPGPLVGTRPNCAGSVAGRKSVTSPFITLGHITGPDRVSLHVIILRDVAGPKLMTVTVVDLR